MSNNIAVCIATYQGAKFIEAQLASIVLQLATGDHILLADDGSTDATVDIVSKNFPEVRIVAVERVGGVVENFERVLNAAHASGAALIVLCDQDDVWNAGRLELIRTVLRDADLMSMDGVVVDDQLRPNGDTIASTVGVRRGLVANLAKNSYVGCCMAFRRHLLDIALPFPPRLAWHDWYIGLIAESLFKVARLPDITILYRRHGANHSPTGEKSGYSASKRLFMRIHMLLAVLTAVWRYLINAR
ncbi:glycosyltransferase [Massilia sp. PWRC2]|uniref:glycosyltransferase n=1 Tax=Massilia sp. PWRC2 TaxID=2804626 RepID=UPI003CF8CBC3